MLTHPMRIGRRCFLSKRLAYRTSSPHTDTPTPPPCNTPVGSSSTEAPVAREKNNTKKRKENKRAHARLCAQAGRDQVATENDKERRTGCSSDTEGVRSANMSG